MFILSTGHHYYGRSSPFTLRHQMEVVGEDGVDAHCQKLLCLCHLVGPKDVAEDAVGMGFLDHFPVEIRLEELNLFTAVANGTLNDLPRGITAAATTANIRRKDCQLLQHGIVAGHKIHVAPTVVGIDKGDDLLQIRFG